MSVRPLLFLLPLIATAGWLINAGGCAATQNTDTFENTGAGTTSGANAGGGGSGQGGDGGANAGNGGSLNLGGFHEGQGGFNPDAACAATAAAASLIPLDMVILLDRSGSMFGSKWTGSVNAITSFVNADTSAGISVGLTYFPVDVSAGQDDCDYTLYDQPAVPIGELPMNAQPIINSLNAHQPAGGTPMWGGLKGVLFTATAYQDANPTHKVIAVLASDGDPFGCDGNDTIPAIAALAQSALNYNGVQTYVIAIAGSTIANLNQIAAAGGTGQAFDVTSDVNDFAEKMAEIQKKAAACEFVIPPPPEGEELNFGKVAVKYSTGDGSGAGGGGGAGGAGGGGSAVTEVEIPKADDLADCSQGPGWYYDDNMMPAKIVLCPASCQTVQDDKNAKINVLFGCEPDLN